MIIYNAKIHTLNKENTVYENGFIEFDEKIKALGDMRDYTDLSSLSDKSEAFDAKGMNVYPGFIDAHSHVGVWGNAEGAEGDDGNEITDPCTPHLRALDMINAMDFCFNEGARAGVTTVVCGPGSANPIAGTFLGMKTAGSPRIDKRVISESVSMKFSFGENPKMSYRERGEFPTTRMASAALIREHLYKAKRYMEAVDKHLLTKGTDDEEEMSEYDIKCESLLPLLRGEMKAHAHCHRADDIFTAMRIADEFGLDLVLVHATDSESVIDELSIEKIPAIIGPVICDRSKPELLSHSIKTAGVLSGKGIKTAICTDHPVVPIQYLPLSAGLCIRGGLSEYNALKSITINAAELCGLDHRIGSLEINKDADITIFSGKFYETLETPRAVFIDGKLVE